MERNQKENFRADEDAVGRIVRELPDEEPSLAWRSELNQKLLAMQPAKRRIWIWKPIAGLALAGGLALALVIEAPRTDASPSTSGIDEVIVAAHRESIARQELGAVPVSSLQSDTDAAPSQWDEVDLSTL